MRLVVLLLLALCITCSAFAQLHRSARTRPNTRALRRPARGKPDLEPENLKAEMNSFNSANGGALMGQPVKFSVEVVNKGTGSSKPCRVQFRIAPMAWENPWKKPCKVYEKQVPALNPRTQARISFTHKFVRQGHWTVWCWVDSKNQVKESNEANNRGGDYTLFIKSFPPKPDMTVSAKAPSHCMLLRKETFRATVRNIGHVPSQPCRLRVVFNKSRKKPVFIKVPQLKKGQSKTYAVKKTFRTKGVKRITFTIDSDNVLAETNEKNNFETLRFRVR